MRPLAVRAVNAPVSRWIVPAWIPRNNRAVNLRRETVTRTLETPPPSTTRTAPAVNRTLAGFSSASLSLETAGPRTPDPRATACGFARARVKLTPSGSPTVKLTARRSPPSTVSPSTTSRPRRPLTRGEPTVGNPD